MEIEYKNLEPDINAELCKDFSDGFTQFIRVGKEGWLYPKEYLEEASNFRNFKARSDDIWITGYPRSGTTVTQDLCWLLQNNFDYKQFKEIEPNGRVPFFEGKATFSEKSYEILRKNGIDDEKLKLIQDANNNRLKNLDNSPPGRVIKTHLPFVIGPKNLLSSGAKIIYLNRNVKDQVVSFYHLQKLIASRPFIGTFEKYWNYFERDLCFFTPYWKHLQQGWEQRNHPNVLFMFYEDIRSDLRGSIIKISKHLGRDLTKQQVDELEEFLSFKNYQKNYTAASKTRELFQNKEEQKKGNQFVRKGEIGGWREHFSDELNERANKWIKENIDQIKDFKYPDTVIL